jgi:hypothetical protein
VPANPVASAREQFERIVRDLESETALGMTHGDLVEQFRTQGFESLRRLFQGHLDARGSGEVVETVVGAEGAARTHQRESERQLITIFGEVTVGRMRYGGRGIDSVIPLDGVLNLPVEQHSHGVRRRVALEPTPGSFDDAVCPVRTTTGATVGKRQTEALTAAAAVDFDAFYAAESADESGATESVLVISTDGKGVVMRPEGLRPATREAARVRRHKLERGLSKGEKHDAKRMTSVAGVCTFPPFVRRPSDIVHALAGTDPGPVRPRPEHKRV